MTLDDIRRVSSEINKLKIQSVSYFNLGDPFSSPGILEELKIIKRENPEVFLYTSTNGLCVDSDDKLEAALLFDSIVFSIDGINTEMVQKYQRNGNFEFSLSNMRKLVDLRNSRGLKKPSIEWKYVLFNWNDKPEYIKKAIEMAEESKVDNFLVWHTFTPIWGASWRWFFDKFYKNLGVSYGSYKKIAISG
ncbi:MAG: hypothetical protein PHV05_03365 [Candidatus Riflebacteria bacterium]|nr:hypothetical protein [Candidatus Riflebacteria bacterium]